MRIIFILFITYINVLLADTVAFTSSNLPIIILDTQGREIPDEPKITAHMKIIWNDDGARNNLTDTNYNYDGKIGIELRGSSSQYFFPKKQYAVETRDITGENLDVSLLGFPEENDWILYAPYSDKTLMRNVLVYTLAQDLGGYASRCKFCELVKNDEYMGIYILMEKIKRDDNRVDINKLKKDEISGDDLTGGYIVKIDKFTGEHTGGWQSNYPARPGTNKLIFYQYHEPKDDEIVDEQKNYIQGKIHEFERIMSSENFADEVSGYPAIINEASFIDYFLINELSKNVDGFRLSTYLFKDKDSNDPKIYAGPVWDYNLAFGNANYYQGNKTHDWMLDVYHFDSGFQSDGSHPPFWWRKLWNEPKLRQQAIQRWHELRSTTFSTKSIFAGIDSIANLLNEAKDRNYERWPNVLGHWIWPNPSGYENRQTYLSEVNYMKSWISARLSWMDENIGMDENNIVNEPSRAADYSLLTNYPNPFNPSTKIKFYLPTSADIRLEVFNLRGELIEVLIRDKLPSGQHETDFNARGLESGVYLYKLHYQNKTLFNKCLLLK